MNSSEVLWQRIMDFLIKNRKGDPLKLDAPLKSPKAAGRTLDQLFKEEGTVRLGQILVEEGWLKKEDLLEVYSNSFRIPPINLSRYRIDPSLAQFVPEQTARLHRLVPISKIGNRLSVAISDPLNVLALDDLAVRNSLEISPVLAGEREIEEAIQQLYSEQPKEFGAFLAGESAGEVVTPEQGEGEDAVVDLGTLGMASGQRAPIVKVVDIMIAEALKARASDIHVEPYEQEVRIRYRVDGSLQEIFRLPKRYQSPFITRLKIMSQLNITESRLPQDGRFKVLFENREVDFRVSMLPISFGNKVVMRVLDKSSLSVGLEQLGLLPESLSAFQKAISRPYGMILVTGPTGSGKSTTLYSILNQINEPGRNILSIEDPVEYQLDGITQVQVNPEIGLTFAGALRAFLRQAPDVVLVGEIRDGETADIAIKASLTGQIVLSTLHTNDAPSSIARLVDMGVDPFLLASSLIFVAAQRLCRQICPQCKVQDDPVKDSALKELNLNLPKGSRLYRGKGCAYCRKTGYRGRFAILEAMLLNDGIREMIISRKTPDEIKAYAQTHGMRSLREEGLVHLLNGRTTIDEIARVTSEE